MAKKRPIQRKKVLRKLPDRNEYDFRGIRSSEQAAALVYEYARSCPWVRRWWQKWIFYTVRNWKLRQDGEKLEYVWTSGQRIRVKDAIRKYNLGPKNIPGTKAIKTEIKSVCPRYLSLICFADCLLAVNDLNTQWLKLSGAERKRFSDALFYGGEPAFREVPFVDDNNPKHVRVEIDWNQPPSRIEDWFERWSDEKRKTLLRQRRITARPAKFDVIHIESAFKQLGALRLEMRGIAFVRAQKHLEKTFPQVREDVKKTSILPFYASPGNWIVGWKRAALKVERLFPFPDKALSLEYPPVPNRIVATGKMRRPRAIRKMFLHKC